MEALARIDERQAKIVDMKFFGGLTAAEIAQVLDISLATVERDWAVARLWLRREMGRTPLQ
jgi:RNA polymerase sigma factor (sigma-70 family)